MPRISTSTLRSRSILLSSILFILSLLLLSHLASARNPEVVIKSEADHLRNLQSSSDDPETNKPHLLAGSYYSIRGGLSATLMLNNKGPHSLEVQPTLFNLSGDRLEISPVTVEANSFRMINLSEWAALGGETFKEGSVQLFHLGRDLVLGAQIYLVDAEHSLSFDEKLVEIGVYGSTRLEGIWWMPSRKSEVSLVLSNTSGDPLSVIARLAGAKHCQGDPRSLSLSPHETRVLDVRRDFPEGEDCAKSDVEAISLEHAGSKSALLARAMIQDAQKGYSFPVQFSNPQGGKSQQYHGAGLRLGKVAGEQLTPIVVARNVGDTRTVLSGRVPYTTGAGALGVVSLHPIELHPGEMKLLDLQRVIRRSEDEQNIATAGLEFEYTTVPGSVVISAQSVSKRCDHMFRVPLWDPLAQRSPTGGYPWYIEGDSSTTVYIKNITDHPQQYTAHILFSGGMYTAGTQTVQGRETVAFNLRQLRDNQVPDEEGRTIPLNVSRGQVMWSLERNEDSATIGEIEKLALIGRSEQVDTTKAISSNYACINCCINSFIAGKIERSSPPAGEVGSQQQLTAYQYKETCYGLPLRYRVGNASWISSNTNAVTIDSGGLATARGAGATTITATWTTSTYQSLSECYPYPEFAASVTAGADAVDPDPDLAACGCSRYTIYPEVITNWSVRCPVPVNFRQTNVTDLGNGTLQFDYNWDSSTGRLADLAGCTVTELVTYNPADLPFPSPPFPLNLNPPNPTILGGAATVGFGRDTHSTPGNFVRPYSNRSVVATQIYQYTCGCANNGLPVRMYGPIAITRAVTRNADGTGRFVITKNSSSSTRQLP